MRDLRTIVSGGAGARFMTLFLLALAAIPAISHASARRVITAAPMISIRVINDSSREISQLFLSPVDKDARGPDLLNGTALRNGDDFTIQGVTCSGNQIKIIAQDKAGCLTNGVVDCSQGSTDWTITDDMPADCGN